MPIPEICDEQVAILRLSLALPGVHQALMPAVSWLQLAAKAESNAAELTGVLQELTSVGCVRQDGDGQAGDQTLTELEVGVEKLRHIAAECNVWAGKGTGNAETFLQLSLTQYQLAQGMRFAAISLYAGLQGSVE